MLLLLLSQHFDKQTLALLRHVLTTAYFLYYGSFYDQRNSAMGSPLVPVIANYYMEYYEQ
jgi:hypothetical protein